MMHVAVVGASGYAGAELAAILARHPNVGVLSLHADSSAGQQLSSLHPQLTGLVDAQLAPFVAAELAQRDIVFLALPHGAAARAAAELVGRVRHVIDLSGDLRLADEEEYRTWYGTGHPAPELLGQAVYGLPELFGAELQGAPLVACAGCYATCAQLAAVPGVVATGAGDVTIVASSGTSGAGRKADVSLSFSEVFGDVRAYRLGRHQHVPEMRRGIEQATSRAVRVTFAPHLLPIERGISACVVMPNLKGVRQSEVMDIYRARYEGCPLVRVLDPRERLPSLRAVVGSNFCEIAPVVDEEGGTLVVSAAIDNLRKGAASQAVQVMNLVCGLNELTGLSFARETTS
ncbi:MAG: N-acetyl-gamma-glutamyl-phosphate reductase [Myxococcota bacterium]